MREIFFLFIIFIFTACYSEIIKENDCYKKDDKYYFKTNNKLVNGKILKYHPNGMLHYELELKKGLKNGKEAYYFTNGNILLLKEYKKGILNGRYIEAHILTQKIIEKGEYLKGKRNNVWEFFDSDGKIKERVMYKNNKKIGE